MAKLLKPAEAAQRLALSPATIRKWIFTKRLPTVRVGRSVRVKEEDLEALVRMGYTPVGREFGGRASWASCPRQIRGTGTHRFPSGDHATTAPEARPVRIADVKLKRGERDDS